MAKKQTRRSISLTRSLYERLKVFAAERGYPMAQLVEQAAEAMIAGKLEMAPRHASQPPVILRPTPEQIAQRELVRIHVHNATSEPPEQVIHAPALEDENGRALRQPTKVAGSYKRIGTCADCGNEAPVNKTDWHGDGVVYDICRDCNEGVVDTSRVSYGARGGTRMHLRRMG